MSQPIGFTPPMCPFTQDIPLRPVMTEPCHHIFGRRSINRWLAQTEKNLNCCPIDRTPIKKMLDQKDLETKISAYVKENPQLFENKSYQTLVEEEDVLAQQEGRDVQKEEIAAQRVLSGKARPEQGQGMGGDLRTTLVGILLERLLLSPRHEENARPAAAPFHPWDGGIVEINLRQMPEEIALIRRRVDGEVALIADPVLRAAERESRVEREINRVENELNEQERQGHSRLHERSSARRVQPEAGFSPATAVRRNFLEGIERAQAELRTEVRAFEEQRAQVEAELRETRERMASQLRTYEEELRASNTAIMRVFEELGLAEMNERVNDVGVSQARGRPVVAEDGRIAPRSSPAPLMREVPVPTNPILQLEAKIGSIETKRATVIAEIDQIQKRLAAAERRHEELQRIFDRAASANQGEILQRRMEEQFQKITQIKAELQARIREEMGYSDEIEQMSARLPMENPINYFPSNPLIDNRCGPPAKTAKLTPH